MIPGATTIMASVTRPPLTAAHDFATGSDQHQQERAPDLREDASPLQGGVEKIGCRLSLDHTLLLRFVRSALPSRFHASSHSVLHPRRVTVLQRRLKALNPSRAG